MMRLGVWLLGAIALGCAALASLVLVGRMKAPPRAKNLELVTVVVAANDLPAAAQITPEDLVLLELPAAAVPVGAFEHIEDVFAEGDHPVPTVGILKSEPLVATRLAGGREGTGIARLVKPNMRAVAIEVDRSVGETGLVFPGASVDVLVTLRNRTSRETTARIVVQHARVLTVGKQTDVTTALDTETEKKSKSRIRAGTFITVEVTPSEAEAITIARNEGQINLALRNNADDDDVATDGVSPGMLFAVAEPEKPKRGRQSRSRARVRIEPRPPEPVTTTNASPEIETYSASEKSRRRRPKSRRRTPR